MWAVLSWLHSCKTHPSSFLVPRLRDACSRTQSAADVVTKKKGKKKTKQQQQRTQRNKKEGISSLANSTQEKQAQGSKTASGFVLRRSQSPRPLGPYLCGSMVTCHLEQGGGCPWCRPRPRLAQYYRISLGFTGRFRESPLHTDPEDIHLDCILCVCTLSYDSPHKKKKKKNCSLQIGREPTDQIKVPPSLAWQHL